MRRWLDRRAASHTPGAGRVPAAPRVPPGQRTPRPGPPGRRTSGQRTPPPGSPPARHPGALVAAGAAFLVVVAAVAGVAGDTAWPRRSVTGATEATAAGVDVDVAGTRDLFDPGVAHALRLTFRDADYQRMLDEYRDERVKTYVEADLTIDGTTMRGVGVRLKGNATLAGIVRDGTWLTAGGPGNTAGRSGGQPTNPPVHTLPERLRDALLDAAEPETLPWLISFDEFVDGRRYQGREEIAVRVAGMGAGPTVLNEALALDLLAAAGEPAQRYAYASFTVNARPTVARLVVENPDDHFGDRLATASHGRGVLYKALSTSRFLDQGDDPAAYTDDFKQVTMRRSRDLRPVVDLVRWVSTASDADFDAHLADHVDVASFARYVALQNLLLNVDDMAGPGRNYHLWYDLTTRVFRVVASDHNLAFTGDVATPPVPQAPAADGARSPSGASGPLTTPLTTPHATPSATGNRLKERFLASRAFGAGYVDAYRTLYRQLFGNGWALRRLESIAKVLTTVAGYDGDAVASDADHLRRLIRQRTAGLARSTLVTGP